MMFRRSPIYYDPNTDSYYGYPVLRAPSPWQTADAVPFSQLQPYHPNLEPYSAMPVYTRNHPYAGLSQFYRRHPAQQAPPPAYQTETQPAARHREASVIHIPVSDSSISSTSPSPESISHRPSRSRSPSHSVSSGATKIQASFRGFSVRKRKPLVQLRLVSAISKELETLESNISSHGFAEKVRLGEKERLRFTESVMALLLRLDAIEGAIPEVAARRKEAVRRAVRLQDAIDALVYSESSSSHLIENPVDSEEERTSVIESENPVHRNATPSEVNDGFEQTLTREEDTANGSVDSQIQSAHEDIEQSHSNVEFEESHESSKKETDPLSPHDRCNNDDNVSESTADGRGSVSESPCADGHDQQLAPGCSDKILFQQLSKECNELKSLLSKLLIQTCAQNKAIASLGSRLDRLEKQHQNRCNSKKQGRLK